jgi:hypothetical protein
MAVTRVLRPTNTQIVFSIFIIIIYPEQGGKQDLYDPFECTEITTRLIRGVLFIAFIVLRLKKED